MSYCGIDLVTEELFESNWVFSNPVPVTYKVSNTKFPVNTTDPTESIAISEDNDGFLKLTLVTQYESYQELEWVELTDSLIEAYNGVWQIISVDIYGSITLSVPHAGVTTGNVHRYYQNYYTVLKLYAGIQPGHPRYAENPIRLVTTLYARPDSENLATFNISEIVRSEFGFENQFCQQQDLSGESVNDLNAWTSVYVEYAESYDVVIGGEVETVALGFTLDSTPDTELMTNKGFSGGATGWSESVIGFDWVFTAGVARATFTSLSGSTKELYQFIPVVADTVYNIRVEYTTAGNDQTTAKILINGVEAETLVEFDLNGASVISYIYTPTSSATVRVGFIVTADNSDTSGQLFNLTLFSMLEETVNYYYLVNGTPQFGYKFGNNAGQYSTYATTEAGKFLTVFSQPRMFPDFPFDLSIIIPHFYFTEPYISLYYTVREHNGQGSQVSSRSSVIPDYGGGVYRLPVSDYPYSPDSSYLTVNIYENNNGVVSAISETKRVNIAKDLCSIHDTYISFLNHLGGWDYFLFTASRRNIFNTPVSQELQRDVFANWDTLFAGGATQFDYIRKEAFNRKQINSQFVTKDERETLIEWLQRAIKVMIYRPEALEESCQDVPLWRTILVESITDSYSDIDKLYILNFTYKETGEVFIQEQ